MLYLSLIIPCYNEEKILSHVLNEVISYLHKKKYNWEIVVVDDGSSDKTYDIAKKFEKRKVRVIDLSKNQGKGAALRSGIINSSGKYIVYLDADLSVSISHLDKILDKLRSNYPVVIGSRRIKGSKILIHQPFIREKMGVFFTAITRLITGVSLNDFTCGFKGFRKNAAHDIFGKSLINRWAYDAEIIFLAKKMGYDIGQIPVSWVNRRDSHVRLLDAIFTTFLDLFRIRLNDFLGKYEKIS
jgi:dolichyl-phosphate beta-glucosyltransferase